MSKKTQGRIAGKQNKALLEDMKRRNKEYLESEEYKKWLKDKKSIFKDSICNANGTFCLKGCEAPDKECLRILNRKDELKGTS